MGQQVTFQETEPDLVQFALVNRWAARYRRHLAPSKPILKQKVVPGKRATYRSFIKTLSMFKALVEFVLNSLAVIRDTMPPRPVLIIINSKDVLYAPLVNVIGSSVKASLPDLSVRQLKDPTDWSAPSFVETDTAAILLNEHRGITFAHRRGLSNAQIRSLSGFTGRIVSVNVSRLPEWILYVGRLLRVIAGLPATKDDHSFTYSSLTFKDSGI